MLFFDAFGGARACWELAFHEVVFFEATGGTLFIHIGGLLRCAPYDLYANTVHW